MVFITSLCQGNASKVMFYYEILERKKARFVREKPWKKRSEKALPAILLEETFLPTLSQSILVFSS